MGKLLTFATYLSPENQSDVISTALECELQITKVLPKAQSITDNMGTSIHKDDMMLLYRGLSNHFCAAALMIASAEKDNEKVIGEVIGASKEVIAAMLQLSFHYGYQTAQEQGDVPDAFDDIISGLDFDD